MQGYLFFLIHLPAKGFGELSKLSADCIYVIVAWSSASPRKNSDIKKEYKRPTKCLSYK